MKKLLTVSILVAFFLSVAFPLSWAVESEAAATGMTGTPDEYKDLEKTLKQDRINSLESRISDLAQANRFLAERVNMLERSVNDLKDKVDRSFR